MCIMKEIEKNRKKFVLGEVISLVIFGVLFKGQR